MLKSGQITGCFNSQLERIDPSGVVVRSVEDGSESHIEADDVLLSIGFESDQSLLAGLGVRLVGSEQAVEHDSQTMETNVAGVHVAGTAVAGTQARFKVYIENSHVHARRIAAALTGGVPPEEPVYNELPES